MTGCVTSGRCPHPGAAPLQQALALGGALLVMGVRKSCSTWGEALLKTLRRAGLPSLAAGKGMLVPHPALSFPHLGTGTGTSPSFSPNISLRASTFAEERGEKRECVRQSGQHSSKPAMETLTLVLDDAPHNLLHSVIILLVLII